MADNKVISEITLLQREVRRLARLFTSYVLRPGPGRPRHPRVTLAIKLRSQGKAWTEIFSVCLPDRAFYESSAAYRNAKLNLKKAVRQREKRAEMDVKLPDSPALQPTNSPKFV
jgi:anthranilate/para-aminobenzoate synthase component II